MCVVVMSEDVFLTFLSPLAGLQQGDVGGGRGGCRHHVNNDPRGVLLRQ